MRQEESGRCIDQIDLEVDLGDIFRPEFATYPNIQELVRSHVKVADQEPTPIPW